MATSNKEKKPRFLKRDHILRQYTKNEQGTYSYTGNWISCTQPAPAFKLTTGRAMLFCLLAAAATIAFGFLPYRSSHDFTIPGTQIMLNSSVFVLIPWAIALILEITALARIFRLRKEGPSLKIYVYDMTAVAAPGMTKAAAALLGLSFLFFFWDYLRKTSMLSAVQSLLATLFFALSVVFLLICIKTLGKLTYLPGKR